MINELKNRRQKLLEGKNAPGMVCIFSGKAPMKSLDQAYPFCVDRNFYYLTGIERENMILVMRKTPTHLLCETKNHPGQNSNNAITQDSCWNGP